MANRVLVIALRILAVVWLFGLYGGVTALIDGRYEMGALIILVSLSASCILYSLSGLVSRT